MSGKRAYQSSAPKALASWSICYALGREPLETGCDAETARVRSAVLVALSEQERT
jgi:hypothetical protein